MFKITVKGTFDSAQLERMRQEEMGQYAKAIKSLDGLEDTMEKHFAPMLIKKGFNPDAVKVALKPFYMGYDFSFEIIPMGLETDSDDYFCVEMSWDGHYWIDYQDEMIIGAMFRAWNMFRPWWWIPAAIQSKLSAIRNPKLFFLPKIDEPTVREQHMAKLLEEVTKRFKKLDENCVIESVFRDNYAAPV